MDLPPAKLLIIGPAWIGDMVMMQSLLKWIQSRRPEIQMDVVAPPWTYPLLHRMPEVHEAIMLAIKHGELALSRRWSLGKILRNKGYAQAIVLPRSFKAALIPWVAQIRLRTGYLGEARWGLLNDIRDGWNKFAPTLQSFLRLAVHPGDKIPTQFEFPRLISDQDNAEKTLDRLGQGKPRTPVLALCPGASYGPAKRWPASYFATIAQQKLSEGWRVWLFGSAQESQITNEIQIRTREDCLDLAGKINLLEALDLLSLATIVVTNDSGLMHLAASVDRRIIALFGSSDPKRTPPLTDKAKILYLGLECSPCFQRHCPLGHLNCLNQLRPEMVLESMT